MPSGSQENAAPPPTGTAVTPTPRTYYVQAYLEPSFIVGDVNPALHYYVRESVIVRNPQYRPSIINRNS